jgi:cytochrome c5
MKKTMIITVIVMAVIQACQKKGLPTITARKIETVKPVTNVFDVEPDLAAGKIIFANNCSRCHDLPKPEQYTTQRWEGILSGMIPRARLNAEQGVHIKAYLKANAAK